MPSENPVSYINTRCVREACERLGLSYTIHDEYGNFLSVNLDRPYFFANSATPFNSSATDKICKDKEFTWKLLHETVAMPKTKGYFDPFPADEQYAGYVREKSYEEIADAIEKEFPFPVIVKMNAGQKGKNVFLCKDRAQILAAVETIFNHESASHDFVALAQQYIAPKKEYRAIVFRKKILLAYEKDISEATFTGNLSPLHHDNAKAVLIDDVAELQKSIDPLFSKLDLEFGGIDIIETVSGELFVLELNTHPGFTYFAKDNGDEPLVQMYQKILGSLT